MAKIWILRGAHEAPGWNQLRKAYEDEKVDIIHLDAKVWAIINAEDEPTGYEGLSAGDPADGMYIDPNGSPLYLAGGEKVDFVQEDAVLKITLPARPLNEYDTVVEVQFKEAISL